MAEQALSFPTVSELCDFIRTVHLRNFVLLGKKAILIAPFSQIAIDMALKTYHAKLVDTPELSGCRNESRTVTSRSVHA